MEKTRQPFFPWQKGSSHSNLHTHYRVYRIRTSSDGIVDVIRRLHSEPNCECNGDVTPASRRLGTSPQSSWVSLMIRLRALRVARSPRFGFLYVTVIDAVPGPTAFIPAYPSTVATSVLLD